MYYIEKKLNNIQQKGNNMEYDFSQLRGVIRTKFGTQNNFAKVLGISENALSQKLNNKIEFKTSEIKRAIDILNISNEKEAFDIFFTEKVEQYSTKRKEQL
jgi:hypothetical protein